MVTDSNPSTAGTPEVLEESRGIRIALAVAAAPVLCCFIGLIALVLLRHRQAALLAGYAALHLTPWPNPAGPDGQPSSFLQGFVDNREILVRNPDQWRMNIGMTSFVGVPFLLVSGTFIVYGAVTRRIGAITGAIPAFLGMAWFCWAPVGMLLTGYEIVLDPVADRLTVDGRTVAPLSDIAAFIGRETRRPKGGVDFHLEALTKAGWTIEIGGPDDRADFLDAGAPLTAGLRHLRGEE